MDNKEDKKFQKVFNKIGEYFNNEDYDKALEEIKNALKIYPERYELWTGKGEIEHALGNYNQAIEDHTKAIELNNIDVRVYYNRGRAYYELKDYNKAIDNYSRAIELDNNYADAYNNRGNVYYGLKDYNKAIDDYSRAIELDNNYAEVYNNRGNVYYELKDYNKAIEDYTKAIELDKNDRFTLLFLYFDRGNTYMSMGQTEKAIQDYIKCTDLDDLSCFYCFISEVYSRIANYYMSKEDAKNLKKIARKIIKNYPNSCEMGYYIQGFAYQISKNYQKAIDAYTKVIEIDSKYARAYFNLASIYQYTDFDKAEKYFNKTIDNIENFVDDNKKYLPYQGLAYIYQKKGDEVKAEEYLQKAIELGYKPEEE